MNKTRKSKPTKQYVGDLEIIDLKNYTVTAPATYLEIKQMFKTILKSKNSAEEIEKIMRNQYNNLYAKEIEKTSTNQHMSFDKIIKNNKKNYILKEIGESLLNLKWNEKIIFETVIQPDILEKIRKCQIELALENVDLKSSSKSKSKSKSSSLSISKIKNPKLNSKTRSTTEELNIIKELVNGTDKVPIITSNPFTSSLSNKDLTSGLMEFDFDFENDDFKKEPEKKPEKKDKNKKKKVKTGGNLTRRKIKSKKQRTSVRRRYSM
jgi:hypothetical protein